MAKFGEWMPAEPGVRRRIFPTGDSLMMMEVHFNSETKGALHSHQEEQLSYCLSGRFQFIVDKSIREIGAGETIHIPSGALHGVIALTEGTLLDIFTPLRSDLLGLIDRGEA